MLVLSRRVTEELIIEVPPSDVAQTIVITQVDIRINRTLGHVSRLGVAANKEVLVDRREVWDSKQRERDIAANDTKPATTIGEEHDD